MSQTLKLQLFSAREITADNARRQIEALSNFENGVFRPQKCDTSEPLKEPFDPKDISEPIRWLLQPGADFKFKSSKPFRTEGYISNRHYPPMWTKEKSNGLLVPIIPAHPEPFFSISWTMWIDLSALRKLGVDLLARFATEMFVNAKAEYGFLTSESDHRAKNLLIKQLPSGATSSKFVGTDPEWGVPGLYWLNLFGPRYAPWLGIEVETVPGVLEKLKGGGISLRFGASPEEAESADVLANEKKAIQIIGSEKFFDLGHPERKPTPPSYINSLAGDGKNRAVSEYYLKEIASEST
ncbi:MAG: hypothetical protein JSS87_02230 [Acidobacteria bacterium]|nr:hypothetical protein [Acidobacteriota bacterium]